MCTLCHSFYLGNLPTLRREIHKHRKNRHLCFLDWQVKALFCFFSQPVGVQLLFHIYVFDISSTLVLCCWFFFFKLCRAEKYGPLYRLFVFHKCMLMPSSHTMVKVSGRMDPCRHVHSCYTYICLPECWRNMLLNINCWSCLKPFTVGVLDQEQVPKGQARIWQSLLPVWTEVSGERRMVWWVSPCDLWKGACSCKPHNYPTSKSRGRLFHAKNDFFTGPLYIKVHILCHESAIKTLGSNLGICMLADF